ncbi:pentapeptide repeat-containing protein [Streptomycetaceae bacterium NBC_01309]
MTIHAAAAFVECVRTQWLSTATLRLRHANVDLTDAVLAFPVAIVAHPAPFVVDEPFAPGSSGTRVSSLRGVDAAHLVLTDTDLSSCVFTGAFHLDQIRLEGRILFAEPPAGWRLHRGLPVRLSRRRTLAEEHHARAIAAADSTRAHRWTRGPAHPDPALTPGPDDLAPVYRALRKASEDAKNEPDAADFYFGEMEMRRRDRERPLGERVVIAAYWLLSGYGLRASRAFAWLGAAMTVSVLLLMLWGLPNHDPKPRITRENTRASEESALVVERPDPRITGSLGSRVTAHRAGKAAEVVFNSVVFRSSGQNLTAPGTVVEMGSRLAEPVLVALAVLAVRSRVRR